MHKNGPKDPTPPQEFFIVGVGASAGGLEAISQLLSALPNAPGMAFVVVQHLDPSHNSLSVALLAKQTKMSVREIQDGMVVEVNSVYVLPPNRDLELEGRHLKLSARKITKGQNLPINFFFESLALTCKDKAIGIILSGSASDGTLGAQAIRAAGGQTFVQDPKSAKFTSMPENAIASGAADFVLEPIAIAIELKRIAEGLDLDAPLAKVLNFIGERFHVDFSGYKRATIQRRVARRMAHNKMDDLAAYLECLKTIPDEAKHLFADLLINVTEFFRDPKATAGLKKQVFPLMLKNKAAKAPIRIWVAGCSTGEEVYSVAISLVEYLGKAASQTPVQIFATDVSEAALQKARAGVYPKSIERLVSKARLAAFFTQVEQGYKVNKAIRDLCLFSRQDVISDPPFAKLDLICCRNLLIYFEPALQKRVLRTFHYALNLEGYLWLGRSEAVSQTSSLFRTVDKESKFFARTGVPTPVGFRFPASKYSAQVSVGLRNQVAMDPAVDLQRESDRINLSRYAPPSVVVNSAQEVVLTHGDCLPYLRLPSGVVSLSVLKMAHPDLVGDLRLVLHAAKKSGDEAVCAGLILHPTKGKKGRALGVTIRVFPLKQQFLLICFEPQIEIASKTHKKIGKGKLNAAQSRYVLDLEEELSGLRNLQHTMIADFEASQEEFTSSSEEMQSTNEEFQSTNEELETAKEELQSTNEELTSTNDELNTRNSDLAVLYADLINLLGCVDIPIVMVDVAGHIRRFTPKAAKMMNLIATDVGRPIGDIRPNFELDGLPTIIGEVIESREMQTHELRDRSGRWFRLQVQPYKTVENDIDGAILALVDINVLKNSLEKNKTALDVAELIASSEQVARAAAEQANEVKDAFLATLSHELRTPLTSILTWAQLLRRTNGDGTKLQQGLETIERSAKAQGQLIDDLLDATRIQSGKMALTLVNVNFHEAIEMAVESVRATAAAKEVQIEIKSELHRQVVRADAMRLQQIVWNLLTNAIKFSAQGGKVLVELSETKHNGASYLSLKVVDQGKGIDPKFVPHLFQRFTQADNTSTRSYGGLGLGLAIVSDLLKLQGGAVSVESPGLGKGATFAVLFPYGGDLSGPTLSESLEKQGVPGPNLANLCVMIVDDEPDTLGSIRETLESFGARVISCNSAQQALLAIENSKPNVFISDIAMPVEDGYSLIGKIRAMGPKRGGDVPALALTAYSTVAQIDRALAAGFDLHMTKPFETLDLGHAVANLAKESV